MVLGKVPAIGLFERFRDKCVEFLRRIIADKSWYQKYSNRHTFTFGQKTSRARGVARCFSQSSSSVFGTARSRGICPSRPRVPTTAYRSALLVRLRRLGDSGWTQGQADAEVVVADLRRVPVPVRRLANRSNVVPTAATIHAVRAV